MNGTMGTRWPTILFFLTTGIFFFGCVWYLWAGNFKPPADEKRTGYQTAVLPSVTATPDQPILLIKDRETVVGDTRIIYRGRHNGKLHVDLYVLALDPHFSYLHRIDEKTARDGFQMGEHHFRLLTAGWGSIRLSRM